MQCFSLLKLIFFLEIRALVTLKLFTTNVSYPQVLLRTKIFCAFVQKDHTCFTVTDFTVSQIFINGRGRKTHRSWIEMFSFETFLVSNYSTEKTEIPTPECLTHRTIPKKHFILNHQKADLSKLKRIEIENNRFWRWKSNFVFFQDHCAKINDVFCRSLSVKVRRWKKNH